MNFQVGDMLRFESNRILTTVKRIMYCIVLEARKDSGIVFWFHGTDKGKQFQQTVDWNSHYGTFERLS